MKIARLSVGISITDRKLNYVKYIDKEVSVNDKEKIKSTIKKFFQHLLRYQHEEFFVYMKTDYNSFLYNLAFKRNKQNEIDFLSLHSSTNLEGLESTINSLHESSLQKIKKNLENIKLTKSQMKKAKVYLDVWITLPKINEIDTYEGSLYIKYELVPNPYSTSDNYLEHLTKLPNIFSGVLSSFQTRL